MRFCFIHTLSYLVDAVVNGLVNSESCAYVVNMILCLLEADKTGEMFRCILFKKRNLVATCRCVENDQHSC